MIEFGKKTGIDEKKTNIKSKSWIYISLCIDGDENM